MSDIKHRSFISYLIKFLVFFVMLNYGTFYYIGLATPGGYYVEFLDRYFDYPEGLLKSLLWGCQMLYSIFGISTLVANYDQLYIVNGAGVQVAYDCLGYGVMSFWAAYVLANSAPFQKKLKWLAGGWLSLWLINVSRISLFLKSVNEKWDMPLGIDHHTWFNIISYLFIFLMIFAYERSLGSSGKSLSEHAEFNSNPDLTNREL